MGSKAVPKKMGRTGENTRHDDDRYNGRDTWDASICEPDRSTFTFRFPTSALTTWLFIRDERSGRPLAGFWKWTFDEFCAMIPTLAWKCLIVYPAAKFCKLSSFYASLYL